MPFSIQPLIEGRRKPLTVLPNDSAQTALVCMSENNFSQLPVVDTDARLIGMVTSDSILSALNYFAVTIDKLRVSHAMVKPTIREADVDIFDLLNDLRNTNAVLIQDKERHLIGIVTTFDTTEYFRRRAENIMLVENIESAVKEHIRAAFSNEMGEVDQTELTAAVEKISDTKNDLIKRFEKALKHYLNLQKEEDFNEPQAIEEVVSRNLVGNESPKSFDELTLEQYIRLLLHKDKRDYFNSIFDLDYKSIGELLNDVRKIRNAISHFRGEISPQQRNQLRFCEAWLDYHSPKLLASSLINVQEVRVEQNTIAQEQNVSDTTPSPPIQEKLTVDKALSQSENRYALLADWLESQSPEKENLTVTFEEIEGIIKDNLPTSARQNRSWWANDDSQQWVGVGWYVLNINITEGIVTFVRKPYAKEYTEFFEALLRELSESAQFRVRFPYQDGRYYITSATLPERGLSVGNLTFSFNDLYKKFRIELFIDKRDYRENKQIFDALEERKDEIEASLSKKLDWQRMNDRKASRISLYYDGEILITDSQDELTQLRKWAVETMKDFQRVMNEKVNEVLDEIVNTQST